MFGKHLHTQNLCDHKHSFYFQDVENELVVQVSMKQEMELAMKLLEKDIHEKQVSIFGMELLICEGKPGKKRTLLS